MVKIKNKLGNTMHGEMDGFIFCTRNGTNYLRRARERLDYEASDEQKVLRFQLKATTRFYSAIKNTRLVKSWSIAGKKVNKNCYNYFKSENCKIFNTEGKFDDYKRIKISIGDLSLPSRLRSEVIGKNTIRIDWLTDEKNYTGKNSDRIHVFMMYNDHTFRFIYRDDLDGKRGDGFTVIELPEEKDHPEHIYCFFESKNGERFSDSEYMRLKWGGLEER